MFSSNMREKEFTGKRPIRNDILLIAGLLIVAAIGMVYLFVFRGQGNTVTVTVDGKTYGVYSLAENITEEIVTGEQGEHRNCLVIQDGKAYMQTATCPDGICVAHAPIFRDGESIVCLPHGVVIAVTTRQSGDSPDIIL